ncbi:very short patch repair endonuclease [Stenotrophomonas maltophilia group sp. msm4]|uniref:DNA mismatch endonuclease Vsr n=1 Tax=Stenotrophomonas TaxID=40323 RepID=UPI0015DE42D0|nr:very short patch repair endonuclease [Stenotrophomonas maltophilia group sp. msm4]MBA0256771.1 DNA mismatch endonuclease Vsr [Stenotrophomonas maltophilia]MBA0481650.1 DNA mismatch endonuclease Vsr [Stenotrophomonas maltophilia]MBA0489311.1 DNA mismatch endonuclease Vsr [Stenotrophomonas maltophilia]MBA0494464.1 DNA mismatch endonuclease Vsr [Stenotrophomonas maltophilia]MBH1508675.1 DNA mismatch endonuclease Vsr [Stenotrophomonas maltophilia]
MDFLDPAARSHRMSLIRSRDTKPEMVVRSYLHKRGLRYRLHDSRLPGKPDLVFPKRGAVVFVHGCFWHGHENCRRARLPETTTAYWLSKIRKNKERDQLVAGRLRRLGWRVLTVWECQLSPTNLDRLYRRISPPENRR